jgi:site-specific DNA-methyltransferase (adenine-specific)
VDSIVTDPPYELGFMGKKWDSSGIAYSVELWQQCLRVLKPGGHLLSFGGTRTYHRVAVAIEDAGFELRDSIAWLYGSGFPKSLDVSKAIDKQAGAEREVLGRNPNSREQATKEENLYELGTVGKTAFETAPSTPEAQQWQGWGTALKPAFEPVIVARKPIEGTVANNVLKWGTGGLNIDGSRIGTTDNLNGGAYAAEGKERNDGWGMQRGEAGEYQQPSGRWPANIILDPYTAELLDEQSDSSRFFYVAKASKRDRNEGLEDLEERKLSDRGADGDRDKNSIVTRQTITKNFHPTVKPTTLMEYLIKLVTPPNGTVLDPFTGSGSTGKAAILQGFDFIGIEMTEEYLPIIEGRLKHAEEIVRSKLI